MATVQVTSQGNNAVSDQSTLTTTVAEGTFGVDVVPDADLRIGSAGRTVGFDLRVTNTGMTTDIYDVTVSGNDWTTTAPSTVGPLAPGASQDIQVSVDIPAAAAPDAVDLAIVRVASQGDSAISTNAILATVNANVGPVFLPIIMK
jgi:uncharacterized membrane protein